MLSQLAGHSDKNITNKKQRYVQMFNSELYINDITILWQSNLFIVSNALTNQ